MGVNVTLLKSCYLGLGSVQKLCKFLLAPAIFKAKALYGFAFLRIKLISNPSASFFELNS